MGVISNIIVLCFLGTCLSHELYSSYHRDMDVPLSRKMQHKRDALLQRERIRDMRRFLDTQYRRDPLAFREHMRDIRRLKAMQHRRDPLAYRDHMRDMRRLRAMQHRRDPSVKRDNVMDMQRFQGMQYKRTSSSIEDSTDNTKYCKDIESFAPDMCTYDAAKECPVCKGGRVKTGYSCNQQKDESTKRFKRIIGGTKSEKGKWPWVVNLNATNATGVSVFWCIGSIISSRFVLTSSSCFNENYTSIKAEDWTVTAGNYLMDKKETSEQTVNVKKLSRHSLKWRGIQYGAASGFWYAKDDIAIMELEKELKFDNNISPICLDQEDGTCKTNEDENCYIAGWGFTEYAEEFPGPVSNVLREVKLPVVTCEECKQAYPIQITMDTTFCAGYKDGGKDACNFDSGGALACNRGGVWYQKGIYVSGWKCGEPDAYGLYTRVNQYKEWIINTIMGITKK